MGFVAQPPHRPHESRIAADMPLHEMVETGSDQQAYGNNRIQLDGDRKARSFQRPPAQHDKHIHPQNSQCRRHMGASEVDKHMLQVCLIGTERGGPFQYARRHHPQRIEYGNRQYRQRERHQSYVRIHIGSDPRPVLQDRDYKTDMTTPMTSVPPSPMNIFDVLPKTLCRKKGIRAPTETAAKIVIGASPARKKSVPKIRHAIMQ